MSLYQKLYMQHHWQEWSIDPKISFFPLWLPTFYRFYYPAFTIGTAKPIATVLMFKHLFFLLIFQGACLASGTATHYKSFYCNRVHVLLRFFCPYLSVIFYKSVNLNQMYLLAIKLLSFHISAICLRLKLAFSFR